MDLFLRKRLFLIAALLFCFAETAEAQTAGDSLAVVSASWRETKVCDGVVHRCAVFRDLYRGPQSVNVVEVDPDAGFRVGLAFDSCMEKTSRMAALHAAVAAINGSYYDMRQGNSACFLAIDRQVVDSTAKGEFMRVTGAVQIRKGKLKLIPWNRQAETRYRGKKGETVLASGPMMLENGALSDWSLCDEHFINAKHPRSAVAVTKDKKILLLTVDGRSPGNAIGVNIPELAHLARMLNGQEALNLDGGGSTTLWIAGTEDNGVVNYPSDNRRFDHAGERRVANIIYICR